MYHSYVRVKRRFNTSLLIVAAACILAMWIESHTMLLYDIDWSINVVLFQKPSDAEPVVRRNSDVISASDNSRISGRSYNGYVHWTTTFSLARFKGQCR